MRLPLLPLFVDELPPPLVVQTAPRDGQPISARQQLCHVLLTHYDPATSKQRMRCSWDHGTVYCTTAVAALMGSSVDHRCIVCVEPGDVLLFPRIGPVGSDGCASPYDHVPGTVVSSAVHDVQLSAASMSACSVLVDRMCPSGKLMVGRRKNNLPQVAPHVGAEPSDQSASRESASVDDSEEWSRDGTAVVRVLDGGSTPGSCVFVVSAYGHRIFASGLKCALTPQQIRAVSNLQPTQLVLDTSRASFKDTVPFYSSAQAADAITRIITNLREIGAHKPRGRVKVISYLKEPMGKMWALQRLAVGLATKVCVPDGLLADITLWASLPRVAASAAGGHAAVTSDLDIDPSWFTTDWSMANVCVVTSQKAVTPKALERYGVQSDGRLTFIGITFSDWAAVYPYTTGALRHIYEVPLSLCLTPSCLVELVRQCRPRGVYSAKGFNARESRMLYHKVRHLMAGENWCYTEEAATKADTGASQPSVGLATPWAGGERGFTVRVPPSRRFIGASVDEASTELGMEPPTGPQSSLYRPTTAAMLLHRRPVGRGGIRIPPHTDTASSSTSNSSRCNLDIEQCWHPSNEGQLVENQYTDAPLWFGGRGTGDSGSEGSTGRPTTSLKLEMKLEHGDDDQQRSPVGSGLSQWLAGLEPSPTSTKVGMGTKRLRGGDEHRGDITAPPDAHEHAYSIGAWLSQVT